MCIALDAMGGDFGPSVVVPAAVKALKRYPRLSLILVGVQSIIEEQLKLHGALKHNRIEIHEASQVVHMDEPPALALKNKRDSSMRVAINLVSEGSADACVSAGNTGALMAIARFVLKMLPGVNRPAIVYSMPSMTGHTHVLDLGANIDCKPEDLFEFAVMGSALISAVENNPHPKIGLLNVGSEAIKGSETVKHAAQLLSSLDPRTLNYIGFVEGDDIYKGTADVVVCDGFVGNVALKASEGLANMFLIRIKEAFSSSIFRRLLALIAYPALRAFQKGMDPNRHNGASFLGLRGIVIKSHGGASIEAFANAIRVAMIEIEKNVPERIQEHVTSMLELVKKPDELLKKPDNI